MSIIKKNSYCVFFRYLRQPGTNSFSKHYWQLRYIYLRKIERFWRSNLDIRNKKLFEIQYFN